jgi:Amt family ammonium transporter
VHTHGIAGLIGGLMVGLVADPAMAVYLGSGKTAGFSVGGLFYGAGAHQLVVQLEAAAFVIACSAVGSLVVVKLVGLVVPLRLPQAALEAGDRAIHGEESGVPVPAPGTPPVPVPVPTAGSVSSVPVGTVMASSTAAAPPPSRT